MLGASGARIYNTGQARSIRSVLEIIKAYQDWQNLMGTTLVGPGPPEWAAYLREWRRVHEFELTMLLRLGKNPIEIHKSAREHYVFESVTVICFYDHNGLGESQTSTFWIEHLK